MLGLSMGRSAYTVLNEGVAGDTSPGKKILKITIGGTRPLCCLVERSLLSRIGNIKWYVSKNFKEKYFKEINRKELIEYANRRY